MRVKTFYYAVRWEQTVRISPKVTTPALAAKSCFGAIRSEMQWVELGRAKEILQSPTKLQALIGNEGNWKEMRL